MRADADASAMHMAGVEADEAMQAAAGGEDAADLSAFLPPTPTDAAALTTPGCATLRCCTDPFRATVCVHANRHQAWCVQLYVGHAESGALVLYTCHQ